jgi:integrase
VVLLTDTMLTVKKIEAAKALPKAYKLADADGLYLQVLPTGGKSWRYNHVVAGKQNTKTYGRWPAMSLAEARLAHAQFRDSANTLVAAPTFKEVAADWLKIKLPTLSNGKHQIQVAETLERHVYPAIGERPIDAIKRAELVAVVRAIDDQGITETAHRVAGRIGMVFAYAQDCGVIESTPATGLTRVLRARVTKKPMVSIPAGQAGALLRDISTYPEAVTRLGLLLAAHTFVRVGELRGALWEEIDFEARVWLVAEDRMKKRRPHVVPLSDQVVDLLRELHTLTGHSVYVLDSPERTGRPISENTLLFALYRLGYRGRMTVHGFRSLASTVLNEQSSFTPDAIERQLAHKEVDAVRAAYNRAQYFDERVKMMQWWSDWLTQAFAEQSPATEKRSPPL